MNEYSFKWKFIFTGLIAISFSFLIAIWLIAGKSVGFGLVKSDVEIRQQEDELIINVNNPNQDQLTWQYKTGVSETNCQENNFRFNEDSKIIDDSLIQNSQTITLNIAAADLGKSYCFKTTKVAEDDEVVVWNFFQTTKPTTADDQPPEIKIQRLGNNLIAITTPDTDVVASSWRYDQFDSRPNCKTATLDNSFSNRNLRLGLREEDNDKWYCFKVADNSGNVGYFAYLIQNVDTTPPVIDINQEGRVLEADVSEETVQKWSYIFSAQDIDCRDADFLNNRSLVRSQRVTLTADRINYYYCFRAADRAGNYGYAKYKIESVDFSAPKITLQQEGLKILVSSNKPIETWHYLKFDTNTSCNQQTNFASAQNLTDKQIILTADDHQRYFCVRGTNAIKAASFARLKVDTQISEIKLNLDINKAVITATTTDQGVDWGYIKTKNQTACDETSDADFQSDNFDHHLGSSSQLNELDNNLWICFRAVDKADNKSYAQRQIKGITKKAPDSPGSSRGRTDILVIVSLAVGSGLGLLIYKIIEKRKQKPPVDDDHDSDSSPQSTPRKPKKKSTKKSTTEITQPLDYLKDQDQ